MLAVGIALLYNYIRSIGAAQALPDERIEAEVEKGMDSGQGTVISDQGKRGRRAILAKRILLYLLIGVVLVGGAAWAPWITRDFAAQRAGDAFTGAWQGVMDGCGLQCKGCGVKEPVKVWFGYWVPIGVCLRASARGYTGISPDPVRVCLVSRYGSRPR